MPKTYTARGEAAVLFTVDACDVNCPQHIPQMVFADDVAALEERVAALESENKRLREAVAVAP
jgi:predicted pyridoxine 5'-phosphate oxidase superfamily flavin-nucleotide-binding protein